MARPAAPAARVSVEERRFPAHDPFHGTPDSMLWRRVTIETDRGTAAFEQTDYGHPGRLNPWEPRGIAPGLLPQLSRLQAIAEAIGAFLDA
jgi:hypothetical protein